LKTGGVFHKRDRRLRTCRIALTFYIFVDMLA
jgi:hypothetical protein